MIRTATDIYIDVQKMVDEANDKLATDDVLYGDPVSYARLEAERGGLLRVLHLLEDEYGVLRPLASLTAHLPGTGVAPE